MSNIVFDDALENERNALLGNLPISKFSKYVPRVRIGFKDINNCLVVIYDTNGSFVRWEFSKDGDGVYVDRFVNTYDSKKASSTKVVRRHPIEMVCLLLKSALIDPRTDINTVEIEFSDPNEAEQIEILDEIQVWLGLQDKFLAEKFMRNPLMAIDVYINLCFYLFDQDALEEHSEEGIHFDTENSVPRMILDSSDTLDGHSTRISEIYMNEFTEKDLFQLIKKAINCPSYVTLRLTEDPGTVDWNGQEITVERPVLSSLFEARDMNVRVLWKKSACGVWVHAMKKENEKKVFEMLKTETCGLRWLCKKCSHPFDYNFYRNLPRRVYHEPEWIDIGFRPETEENQLEFLEKIQILKAMIESEVKEERKEQGLDCHQNSVVELGAGDSKREDQNDGGGIGAKFNYLIEYFECLLGLEP